MPEFQRFSYDVLVIGAGGAGLRAAIEAGACGAKVGVVCKSLLGKAHTVMAEGGMAAAMGNVDDRDNWKVHFADTMRGGPVPVTRRPPGTQPRRGYRGIQVKLLAVALKDPVGHGSHSALTQVPRWAAPERDDTAPSRLSDKQRDILALLVTNAADSWI